MKPALRKVVIQFVIPFVLAFGVAFSASGQTPSTKPASDDTRVFLSGDPQELWAAITTTHEDKQGESIVFYRPLGDQKLTVVARSPQQIATLARWNERALLLYTDGQWMSVWPGGSVAGAPLPANGRILTLAGDSQTVWAIGSVQGGFDAARAATRPTTLSVDASQVAPTSVAPTSVAPTSGPSHESPLVLFRLDGNQWTAITSVPVEAPESTTRGAQLLISDLTIAVSIASRDGGTTIFSIDPSNGAILDQQQLAKSVVSLFTGSRGGLFAWARHPDGKGPILPVQKTIEATSGQIDASQMPNIGAAALGSASGYLRLLSVTNDGDLVQQRLNWDGSPIGKPEPLQATPAADELPPWSSYANYTILALLVVSIMASYRHREEVRLALVRADRPRPAKLWVRLCAATIDALPVIVGCFIYYLRAKPGEIAPASVGTTIPVLIGVAVYLLHTTVTELFLSRTLGKAIFGLSVVDLQGKRATKSAILIRNGVRIVDLAMFFPLMLLLVAFSPFRQRAGDAAAGTVVIDLASPSMRDEPDKDI